MEEPELHAQELRAFFRPYRVPAPAAAPPGRKMSKQGQGAGPEVIPKLHPGVDVRLMVAL